MTYVNLNATGFRSTTIDFPRFATDLITALNALDTNPALEAKLATDQGNYPDELHMIDLGGGNCLRLSFDGWKKRVNVSIEAAEIKYADRNTYDKAHRTESASVNPDGRNMAAIAADILRRVIVPSRPALELQRTYAAQQAKNRNGMAEQAAALRRAVPGISVRLEQGEQSAAVYGNEPYLSGTLSCDGKVRLRDVAIAADKLPALIKLLG